MAIGTSGDRAGVDAGGIEGDSDVSGPHAPAADDPIVVEATGWATLVVRQRHPDPAEELVAEPDFGQALRASCERIVQGAVATELPGDVAQAVAAALPGTPGRARHTAMVDALTAYLSVGGCGSSIYLDAVVAELES